jgi:SNF2 family DNA or RNA helicase
VKSYGAIRYHAGGAASVFATDDARPEWEVTATPDVMIRLKRLFPRADKRRTGAITLVDTPEIARELLWLLHRWTFEVSDEDRRRLTEGAAEHERTEQAVHAILAGDRPHLDFATELAREPRDYQLVAGDLALTTHHLLLADDLGLGKSMSSLLVLRHPDALPALIVCPTHLPRQWVNELRKTFPWLRPHIIRSLKPYDPARRREMKGYDPDVLVIGYSKLRGWGDHLAGRVRTVIFDEAQELRRADSDKYKAAAQIADQATFTIGATATPVYNYGGEMHNIMEVLAPGVLGSREEFAREWGGGAYWHDKLGVADPAALGTYLRDAGLMLRRTRKEVGRELPEVVRVPHTVEADEEVLDKLTGVAKAPYVAEFVRLLLESEEKVVLFGWHRDVYDIWAERLAEYNPAFYTGEESPAQKDRAVARFVGGERLEALTTERTPGSTIRKCGPEWAETRLLVVSLRSGAGLDGLQEAAHVAVFGELDWSPGMHDQCIGRLHRDGQDEAVVAYFLVSDEGADPVMAEVLNLKRQQAEPIRDPDGELFEQAEDTRDRVRRLAADVLKKQRQTRIAA